MSCRPQQRLLYHAEGEGAHPGRYLSGCPHVFCVEGADRYCSWNRPALLCSGRCTSCVLYTVVSSPCLVSSNAVHPVDLEHPQHAVCLRPFCLTGVLTTSSATKHRLHDLTDIVVGNNGGFDAMPGYDLCTGTPTSILLLPACLASRAQFDVRQAPWWPHNMQGHGMYNMLNKGKFCSMMECCQHMWGR